MITLNGIDNNSINKMLLSVILLTTLSRVFCKCSMIGRSYNYLLSFIDWGDTRFTLRKYKIIGKIYSMQFQEEEFMNLDSIKKLQQIKF